MTMLLKCMYETALTMFSHFLTTDMPGTSSQTRLRLNEHFETNVMCLYSYNLYAPSGTVSADTKQPGKQQPADISG